MERLHGDFQSCSSPQYGSPRTGVAVQRTKRLQLDIKTAFLNSELQEELYMEPVEGYENSDRYVWILLRALHWLNQASRTWYENLTVFLLSFGFTQGKADTCLFVKIDGEDIMIVLVYVGDMLVFGADDDALTALKLDVETAYEVNQFDDVNYFLGIGDATFCSWQRSLC